MNPKSLNNLSFAEQQQLKYIDFTVFFIGHLSVDEIQHHFKVEQNQALQALALYNQWAPLNLAPADNNQRYFQTREFKSLFYNDTQTALAKLVNETLLGASIFSGSKTPFENTSLLNLPDIQIVARLVQAICNGNGVNIIYSSLTSGATTRDFVPHTIVDNGLRWHVRGYDRKTNSFRDFVLTRISKVTINSNDVVNHECKSHDRLWNTDINLKIVAHPKNVLQKQAIEMDFGMVDGYKQITTKAALAGYLLRRWNVDCSANANLQSPEYLLYLENQHQLQPVEDFTIAPGIS